MSEKLFAPCGLTAWTFAAESRAVRDRRTAQNWPPSWTRYGMPVKLSRDEIVNTGPDASGHYGPYGGRFVPETLMGPLQELEAAYDKARRDPVFHNELQELFHSYSGRPTPLTLASRISEHLG